MTKKRQKTGGGELAKTATAAADRFFRAYYRHSLASDEDTLFDLLNAIHSLNDKLGKSAGANLHGSPPFTVLRKLRNLFHHEAELLHEVRMIHARDIPVVISDLASVCLVSRSLVLQSLKDERKPEVSTLVMTTVRWYGTVADIQPCIFNAAVDVYEAVQPLDLDLRSEAYAAFRHAYDEETLHGQSHHVSGELSSLAADVDTILERLFRQRVGARS
ncbi:hypothetical protein [Bradyrhizobium sp. 17]|uniref:hypothetical protein n=1 Tax=Bradyrhizobium sp. 17 TaxID=2782649 RepID=UPI001FF873AD|nr:hypothetical protein [Bradyrhizobium sp. 17]MCK1519380.1 hypothetical protein [Bradyrhizobium sp. 17]